MISYLLAILLSTSFANILHKVQTRVLLESYNHQTKITLFGVNEISITGKHFQTRIKCQDCYCEGDQVEFVSYSPHNQMYQLLGNFPNSELTYQIYEDDDVFVGKELKVQVRYRKEEIEMDITWNRHTWLGLFQQSIEKDIIIFNIVGDSIEVKDGDALGKHNQEGKFKMISSRITEQGWNAVIRYKSDRLQELFYVTSDQDNIGSLSEVHELHNQTAHPIRHVESVSQDKMGLFYVHGIILFIGWGLLADVGIIVIRYYKSVITNYQKVHGTIFFFVDFSTIILIILMITDRTVSDERPIIDAHSVLAFIMLIVLIIQHFGGAAMMQFMEKNEKKDFSFVIKMRKFHMITGMTIYTIAKVELIIGLIANQQTTLLILGIIWIALLFVIRAIIEMRTAHKRKKIYIREEQASLLPQQNDGDLMKDIRAGVPTVELLKKYPDTLWVIFQNDVYDLTNYHHPAGNFIIKAAQGQEISKYLFGNVGIEFIKSKTRHNHTQTAFDYLRQFRIGSITQGTQEEYTFQEQKITNTISLFNYSKKGLQIDVFQEFNTLGQHYNIGLENSKIRQYTKVYCMSKARIAYRDSLLAGSQTELTKSDSIPIIMKKYDYPKALTPKLFAAQKIHIDGPLGRGLELQQGHSMAIAGGTGIVTFLDLLDLILCAILRKEKINYKVTLLSSFVNQDEFIGKDWIRKLYQICRDQRLDYFDMKVRYSDKSIDPVIPTVLGHFDKQLIMQHDVIAIYLSGTPAMGYSVFEQLKNTDYEAKLRLV